MKNIRAEIRNIVGIEIKSDSIDDTEAVELENLFRSLASEIRNKKFPIGERRWCKECGDRIANFIEGVI